MHNSTRDALPVHGEWDDHAAWDNYYSVMRNNGDVARYSEAMHVNIIQFYFMKFVENRFSTIWFPGCGVDLSPHIFALGGFQVWASDVSATALVAQEELGKSPAVLKWAWLREFGPPQATPGRVHLFSHDFRQPLDDLSFDCILNIRAFQGLPLASMQAAADSHFRALHCRGEAFFHTHNANHKEREQIQSVLRDSGFVSAESVFQKVTDWRARNWREADFPPKTIWRGGRFSKEWAVDIEAYRTIFPNETCFDGPAGEKLAKRLGEWRTAFEAESTQRFLAARLEALDGEPFKMFHLSGGSG